MDITKHVKLLAKKTDLYSKYVFQDLDTKEFILSTVLPAWDIPFIDIGDLGFADFEYAEAGKTYYNKETGETDTYKYNKIYFKSFIQENNSKDLLIL